MKHPDLLGCVLLALAGFRTYRLLAEDTILNRPRQWALGLQGWQSPDDPPDTYREGLALWLTCPWCAGFWHAAVWWGAWMIFPGATLMLAVPWALSAALALIATRLDPSDE